MSTSLVTKSFAAIISVLNVMGQERGIICTFKGTQSQLSIRRVSDGLETVRLA